MILRVRYDTMTMFDRVWPEVDFGGLINMGGCGWIFFSNKLMLWLSSTFSFSSVRYGLV